jgi:hypothetical protein
MPTFVLLQLVTVLHILQGNPIPLKAAHLVHDDGVDHLVGRQVHLEVHHVSLLFRDLPQGLLEMPVACTEDIICGIIFKQVVMDEIFLARESLKDLLD